MPDRAPESPAHGGFLRRRTRRGAALAAALLALTSCAPSPPDGVPAEPLAHEVRRDDALAQQVPQWVRQDGVLTIGTDPSFPPMEDVLPDGRLTGIDIQLASAIAQTLGLRPAFRLDAFTAIEPGVRAGRFEMGIAALSVAPGQRLSTDAVLYFQAGSQLVRPIGSGVVPDALCGLPVGTPEGSVQIQQLVADSAACIEAGAAPIAIIAGETQEAATRDLLAGRTAALLTDSPVAQVAVREHPEALELAGPAAAPLPYAILVPQAQTAGSLGVPVLNAVNRLIGSSVYTAILDDAGITDGAVPQAVLVRAGIPIPADPFGPPDGAPDG